MVYPISSFNQTHSTKLKPIESQILVQDGNTVDISNAGEIPIGTFVRFGDFIGVITSHFRSKTKVALLFEKNEAKWGPPLRAVASKLIVTQLTNDEWYELQRSLYPKRVAIGNIRQPNINSNAYLPPLSETRTLIIGTSGAGKTTAMISILAGYRNAIQEKIKKITANQPHPIIPGLLGFDIKQDLVGNLRDADYLYRPNLYRCFIEELHIYRFGQLCCSRKDVPIKVILQCLGKLSPAQDRWCSTYLNEDEGHEAIDSLLGDENLWPEVFPKMTVDGKLTASNRDSLITLRAIFMSFFSEPLFSEKNQSNWKESINLLYEGKSVVIDLTEYSDQQRNLLAVLILRSILLKQIETTKKDQPCYPIIIAGPEFHQLSRAKETIEHFARVCRAYNIGFLFDSQDLNDFPEIVGNVINRGIVMRIEGESLNRILRRFPQLIPYKHQILQLEPGTGFIVSGHLAIPVQFVEPEIKKVNNR